jgi:ABC-type transport system involved in cytochrome bd biosynthesis fused ATPase/permease subunit
MGSKSTNSLIALIYEKQLKLSSATNKVFSQGEIITFVQVDAQKMIYLTSQMPWVATLPFTLIMCFILLFKYLGISFLAGVGVFVVSLLVNISLSRWNARVQKRYMKKLDARVSITTECLNNIKMIKLFSWVGIFDKLIASKRNEELGMQLIRISINMIIMSSLYFFPIMLKIVSFTTYIGTGHSIDISLAFTIITIFNIII